jgi:hypothetical protein
MGIAGLIFYGGPAAIIEGDKHGVKLEKIIRMDKFFMTENGIFESDPNFEYLFRKQFISFFNSHGVKISKKVVNKVRKLYRKKDTVALLTELRDIEPTIDIQCNNVLEAMQYIVDKTNHHAIDLDTEKYLYGHIAYNPKAVRMAKQFAFNSKKGIESLAQLNKKVIPFILVMGGLVAFAIVAQHLTEWIGSLTSWFGHLHF